MADMDKIAAVGDREGWKLVTVIDNGTTKPYYDIAGTRMSDHDAKQHVIRQAKSLSAVHSEVVRLVVSSRVAAPKRRKK